MKKHLFSKYFAYLLLTCFLGFVFLIGFVSLYTMEFFSARQEEQLEQAAQNAGQSVSTMMELSQQDFNYLLTEKRELLFGLLAAQTTGGDNFFITDGQGKIVISRDGSTEGNSIPSSEFALCRTMAKESENFQTDLGGLLPEKKMCRVLLLEKEFEDGHKQSVGAIILLKQNGMQSYLNGLLKSFLVAGALTVVMVLLSFHFMSRELVHPLQLLSEAAESFAKGDFTHRLPELEGGEMTPLLRAFNEMAQHVEENEKLRQTFVSNVSHDLRTPLTTIGGFIQNMESGAIPPEKQGHYYKIILDEVARLSRLVQTLLETSRMTAGERKYSFAPMDICELARITLLSFETRIDNKHLEVDFSCDRDSITVLADRDAIQQVIYNLLDNAIKFTPEKGLLSLGITLQRQKALFEVKNSGDGIPEEELRHLFDRFYKSDRSRGLDKGGMGLGLFIAKTITAAHGEEIWVESKVGEFTSFHFSLPLTDGKEAPSSRE
ncbi:MAG: HAMP domain-containing histidine kinase [Clostridia bacterium]|nr:HAMP domain-containing histidine kinase [Clostridia bacterium]